MRLQNKQVLVTGGTGAIGGRLVEKLVLEEGARVRVLVRNFGHVPRIACFPIEMIGGDITDAVSVAAATEGCDIVFHCAYDFSSNLNDRRQAGIGGTRNVCEAVLKQGARRLVYLSTFAVYGRTRDGELTETSTWQPSETSYANIKGKAESLVVDLHHKRSLPAVILQPTIVYGPFCTHWTTTPVSNLLTSLVPLVDGGQGLCNAVYVGDVVDAMIQAATKDVTGEVFLISGDTPVTWKEFYGALESALRVKATAEFSIEELRKLRKANSRRPTTLHLLADLMRHPEVSTKIREIPMFQAPARLVRSILPQWGWNRLKAQLVMEKPETHRVEARKHKPVNVPDETTLALYQSKTRVSIAKAKTHLGYSPRFDFHQGMQLTTEFIRWANLA